MGWASLETAVCTGSTASRIDVPDHWCHEVILLHFKCQMIVVFCSHGSVLYSGVWDEKMLCKRTLRTAIFGRWHHLCQPEEISTAAWLHFLMSMFSPWFFNRPFNIRETVAAKNITEAHVSTAISHHWITAKQHDSMTRQSHPSRPPEPGFGTQPAMWRWRHAAAALSHGKHGYSNRMVRLFSAEADLSFDSTYMSYTYNLLLWLGMRDINASALLSHIFHFFLFV